MIIYNEVVVLLSENYFLWISFFAVEKLSKRVLLDLAIFWPFSFHIL
jgi:hypothetical protein